MTSGDDSASDEKRERESFAGVLSVVSVVNRSNPISRGWGENIANVIMVFKISVLNGGPSDNMVPFLDDRFLVDGSRG